MSGTKVQLLIRFRHDPNLLLQFLIKELKISSLTAGIIRYVSGSFVKSMFHLLLSFTISSLFVSFLKADLVIRLLKGLIRMLFVFFSSDTYIG